jgi:hypothetical protein
VLHALPSRFAYDDTAALVGPGEREIAVRPVVTSDTLQTGPRGQGPDGLARSAGAWDVGLVVGCLPCLYIEVIPTTYSTYVRSSTHKYS